MHVAQKLIRWWSSPQGDTTPGRMYSDGITAAVGFGFVYVVLLGLSGLFLSGSSSLLLFVAYAIGAGCACVVMIIPAAIIGSATSAILFPILKKCHQRINTQAALRGGLAFGTAITGIIYGCFLSSNASPLNAATTSSIDRILFHVMVYLAFALYTLYCALFARRIHLLLSLKSAGQSRNA